MPKITERKKQVKAQGWWTQPEGQAPAPTIRPVARKPISREQSSFKGLSDKPGSESGMDDYEDGGDKVAGQKRGGLWYVYPGDTPPQCARSRERAARMAPYSCRIALTDRGPQAKAKEIQSTCDRRLRGGAAGAHGFVTASRCTVGADEDTDRCHRFVCVCVCVCEGVAVSP